MGEPTSRPGRGTHLDFPSGTDLAEFLFDHVSAHGEAIETWQDHRVLRLDGAYFYVGGSPRSISGPHPDLASVYRRTGRDTGERVAATDIIDWFGLVVALSDDREVYGPIDDVPELVYELGTCVYSHAELVDHPAGSAASYVYEWRGHYLLQDELFGFDLTESWPTFDEALDQLYGDGGLAGFFVTENSHIDSTLLTPEDVQARFSAWPDAVAPQEVEIPVNGVPTRFVQDLDVRDR